MEPVKKALDSVVKVPVIRRGFIFPIKALKGAEKEIGFAWEEIGKFFLNKLELQSPCELLRLLMEL